MKCRLPSDIPSIPKLRDNLFLTRLILVTTDEKDSILDPMMGVGSVPTVAIRLKRNCTGIELSKEWFDKSIERINKERNNIE